MLGNEGDQQEDYCYHGDEDASRDPWSVHTRSHAKRGNPTHTTRSTIDEVIRDDRLRWFGHAQRRGANNVARRVRELAIPGTRRRGRYVKTWHQQIKDDMMGVGVTQDVTLDRKEWRRRTKEIGKRPSCAFLCQIVSLQYLSRSSRLAGLPCRHFVSYVFQVVTHEVHRSSLRRLMCPAQDHLIFLTLLISMTFVCSLTQMLVCLSLYVMLNSPLSMLVCAAASLFLLVWSFSRIMS